MNDEYLATAFAKLTPEQREMALRGVNEAFAGVAAQMRLAVAGMNAALQTVPRLYPAQVDESPGLVWSELLARIDELTERGEGL